MLISKFIVYDSKSHDKKVFLTQKRRSSEFPLYACLYSVDRLNFVFQAPLLPALDIIDNRNVMTISCPSGRKVYQVIGTSGTPYICLPSGSYCSCPAYRYSVLLKDDHLMCKHVLAIKLAEAMDLSKSQQVTDLEMTNLIKNLE
uniref:Zinc finger SWIM domain-containing protein 7 n=1 Tax=Magallana gigas TaxID=29159 RepID=K1PKP6_MAGGI